MLACWLLCLQIAQPVHAAALRTQAHQVAQALLPFYMERHRHPELSLSEIETSAAVAAAAKAAGAEVHTNIGGHGIVAILRNRRRPEGPTVLWRADMDALPVREATGLPYSSQNPGVMHACGHDIHMTTAVGLLRLLETQQAAWRGVVVLLGQPAEEMVAGARAMLADGKLHALLNTLPPPRASLALHVDATLPAGSVGLLAGGITANVDSVDITLFGKGGHGAHPEGAIDAAVMAAHTVTAMQTVVARRVPVAQTAVVTIGVLQAGTKRNIIANEAKLMLTIRTFTPAVRRLVLDEVTRIAAGVAQAFAAPRPPEVRVLAQSIGSVYNDPALVQSLHAPLAAALGNAGVKDTERSTGGEDFGLFGEALHCPSVLLRLGAVPQADLEKPPAGGLPGLHSESFAPDALPTLSGGIAAGFAAITSLSSD